MASSSSSLSRSWVTRSSTVLRSTTSKKINSSSSSPSSTLLCSSFSTHTSSPRLHLSSPSRLGSSFSSSISSSSISTPRSPFSFSSFSTLSSTSSSTSSLPSTIPSSSLSKHTFIRALSSASPASLTDDVHQNQQPHTSTMTVSETNNNIHIQQISKSSYLNQSKYHPRVPFFLIFVFFFLSSFVYSFLLATPRSDEFLFGPHLSYVTMELKKKKGVCGRTVSFFFLPLDPRTIIFLIYFFTIMIWRFNWSAIHIQLPSPTTNPYTAFFV